jgi:hypothetical protein
VNVILLPSQGQIRKHFSQKVAKITKRYNFENYPTVAPVKMLIPIVPAVLLSQGIAFVSFAIFCEI